ncbi:OPT oligopeptide transporter protein-domain-containing protein [Mycena albidolilacea]|uniref:OPT oligopeptide transporter protein-domain-containing protein n=1 Tax=Mycena albidolilacea TaxID=1033008 RepID=A0AAD6ZC73_9AGAR|nr:OPT oligopeptide transporter protein-domain-containing protein [Mycena albidolilacea]
MGLFSLPLHQTAESGAPSPVQDLGFKASASDLDLEMDDSLMSKEKFKEDVSDVDTELTELTPMEALKWNVDGDQSPFPEVQACVSTEDDESLEVNTFRMWALMTIFIILFSGVNMFFSLRYPSLSLTYVVAQLLVFPVGKAWERLPTWRVGFGSFSFRINPGKFNVKEHAIIVICVNLTASTAYAMGGLVAMTSEQFWNWDFGAGFGVFFILTTQFIGFGLAGLARRWIVYPGALIWPSTLSSTVLFRALHEPQEYGSANGWTMTRYKFFFAVTAGSFVWFWFPDYIFQALFSGLGLIPISFDWTVITYAGAPLTTPFYVTANCFAAVAIFYLGIAPILYYTGVWYSDYLPLLSSSTFDNTGASYNISKVVNADFTFNEAKYKTYSPISLGIFRAHIPFRMPLILQRSLVNDSLLNDKWKLKRKTGIIFHTYLYNGSEIWAKFRNSREGGEDIHKRLMNKYKDVPDWWYGIIAFITLGLELAEWLGRMACAA